MNHTARHRYRTPLWMLILVLLLSGCAKSPSATQSWNVQRIAQLDTQDVQLMDTRNRAVGMVDRDWIRRMIDAQQRIEKVVGIRTVLLLIEGRDPNASAWMEKRRKVVAFNLGMVRFLEGDIDQFAFVFGHEIAHNLKRHSESRQTRDMGISAVSFALGAGLSYLGVPMGGTITDLGGDMVKRKFDRDQERESDALGIHFMIKAGFDPRGAIRFHQRLLGISDPSYFPFLSTHPTGQERIDNLYRILRSYRR